MPPVASGILGGATYFPPPPLGSCACLSLGNLKANLGPLGRNYRGGGGQEGCLLEADGGQLVSRWWLLGHQSRPIFCIDSKNLCWGGASGPPQAEILRFFLVFGPRPAETGLGGIPVCQARPRRCRVFSRVMFVTASVLQTGNRVRSKKGGTEGRTMPVPSRNFGESPSSHLPRVVRESAGIHDVTLVNRPCQADSWHKHIRRLA